MEFKYQEKWQYLTRICLNITDACNLACRYCFVHQHPNFMELQTAKDAADWLYKNLQIKIEKGYCSPDEKCQITFFGGEPMLLYDKIIVPLVLYCEEKYPNIFQFGMTTNVTLLDKEKIDFLFDHKIYPLLSIDGAKETQDYNRPCQDGTSSFDKVYKNLPYLLEKMPNLTFRSTILQDTVKNTFKNYLFAEVMGFRQYFTIPNCREKWTEENKNILKNEIKKIFLYEIDHFLRNELPINFSRQNEVFEYILQRDINIASNHQLFAPNLTAKEVNRCGLATVGGSIGYNGAIFGCQEQDSHEILGDFYLGNIYTGGINIERHKSLLTKIANSIVAECDNKELCKDCLLKSICQNRNGFACPTDSYDLFKNFTTQAEITCFWYQILTENCLIMQDVLKDNQLFQKYLQKNCNYDNYLN